MTKIVWTFTNKRGLNKKEFIDYFERKIFKTIRKYQMLPSDKVIKLKDSKDINTLILKNVLERKFKVEISQKPNFSSDNLSQFAEDIFKNILDGNFEGPKPDGRIKGPLYFVSDKEIELYAKLMGIKGEKRKRDEKIQSLFNKFLKKNPDLELNVVNALAQLE